MLYGMNGEVHALSIAHELVQHRYKVLEDEPQARRRCGLGHLEQILRDSFGTVGILCPA